MKKNGFEKTYASLMEEDTREKVTMTKNELTKLLGIEALMRKNSKSKAFNTMLDIICDNLVMEKSGRPVQEKKVSPVKKKQPEPMAQPMRTAQT